MIRTLAIRFNKHFKPVNKTVEKLVDAHKLKQHTKNIGDELLQIKSKKELHRVDTIRWPEILQNDESDSFEDAPDTREYVGMVRLKKRDDLPENVYAGQIDWIDDSDGLLKTNEIIMIEGSLVE